MRQLKSLRPTPALVVAMIALVAAMSGAAVALPGKGTVNSGDIKDANVRAKDLKRDAVRSKHVKSRSIKGSDVEDDALKGKQILEDKLEAVPEAKTVQTVQLLGDSFERVAATEGADEASALAAAPKVSLALKGQLSIYAKCVHDVAAGETSGRVFIETSADGAILESGAVDLSGAPPVGFLNVATAEEDRQLFSVATGADTAAVDRTSWYAMAPDGTGVGGAAIVAVKQGSLAGGNGVYGDGNVCLFGGDAIG